MGKKQGVGAASPPPGVFGKASPQIQAGGGPGGGSSPHQPRDCRRNGVWAPRPTRPPNIQVFKNREGKSTDVFKNLTKQDEQVEARGLSRPWPDPRHAALAGPHPHPPAAEASAPSKGARIA